MICPLRLVGSNHLRPSSSISAGPAGGCTTQAERRPCAVRPSLKAWQIHARAIAVGRSIILSDRLGMVGDEVAKQVRAWVARSASASRRGRARGQPADQQTTRAIHTHRPTGRACGSHGMAPPAVMPSAMGWGHSHGTVSDNTLVRMHAGPHVQPETMEKRIPRLHWDVGRSRAEHARKPRWLVAIERRPTEPTRSYKECVRACGWHGNQASVVGVDAGCLLPLPRADFLFLFFLF